MKFDQVFVPKWTEGMGGHWQCIVVMYCFHLMSVGLGDPNGDKQFYKMDERMDGRLLGGWHQML